MPHASSNNLKLLRRLATRKGRHETGCFFVTGPHLVAEALQGRATVESLVIAPELADKLNPEVMAEILAAGATVPCFTVPGHTFMALSDDDKAFGLGAVVRQNWMRLEQVCIALNQPWIAVNRVKYPANLGTILRASDGAGGDGVILVGPSCDPYDRRAIRASLGSVFTQNLVRIDTQQFAAWKKRNGSVLVGTSPFGSADYCDITYEKPLVFFMGNEHSGLTAEQFALCDTVVKIPMAGRCDSHNVAVATALVLYEAWRQARAVR